MPVPRTLATRIEELVDGRDPDEPIFRAPGGGVLRLRNWRTRVFDTARDVAGLRDLTSHDLRHTAASLAVASGANVKAVQRMLGHASGVMNGRAPPRRGMWHRSAADCRVRCTVMAARPSQLN